MEAFDIAVIGAGSAGCVLAGRLANRAGLRVALVEAGPDYGPRTSGRWPEDLVDAHRTPDSHDWGFEQSRARVVGGCSAHNECGLVRARPGDYDRWNVAGWSDADLAPVVADVARALPVRVCRDSELAAWQSAFLNAAIAEGFARLGDMNEAPGAAGVAPFPQNIDDGVRWNAAFAFLDSARGRVAIIADTLAERLVLERGEARVLIARGPDGAREIHADRFVLCAGVYGSPAVLLRSGVGPAEHLVELAIHVCQDLAGVGANLHDHPGVGFDYEPSARARRALADDLHSGRFYQSQVGLKFADLHVFPYQAMEDDGAWSFGLFAYYLDPRSRGRLRLTSRDPVAPPAIDLGLLTDADGHDADALLDGVRLIERLTKRSPLAEAIRRGRRRFASDARRARFIRENVTDYAHAVGACRMGPSPAAGDVVDASGRVHGLANVFVADASVMPRIPRANTNFTCFVIGARAADLLATTGGYGRA